MKCINLFRFKGYLSPHFAFLLESVNCLLKAIEIYTDMGKFVMAAKHHQAIGEIYETEVSLYFIDM